MQLIALSKTPYRHLAFLTAGFIYACLGSPTPDKPSAIEAAIALLLITASGVHIHKNLSASFFTKTTPIIKTGTLLFIYGLSIPALMSIAHGNELGSLIRDVIPFVFLLLPLFFYHYKDNRYFNRLCLYTVVFIGIIFSIRSVSDNFKIFYNILSFKNQSLELTYLANSPAVLFTGIFLSGLGLQKLVFQKEVKAVFSGFSLAGSGLVCFIPLAMTIQRASLGYTFCAFICMALMGLYYRPRKTILMLIPVTLIILFFDNHLLNIFLEAAHKTSLVGFNARFEELNAVWNEVSSSPIKLLLGTGWGSTYNSPAVGGLEVNFTHSLLTSMLLKTGLIGVLLTALYITALGKRLIEFAHTSPLFLLSALGPLLIPTFLYASYKSLDFGFLLLLISLYTPTIETQKAIR